MAAKKGAILTPMQKSLAKRAPEKAGGNATLNSGGHVFAYHDNLKIEKDSRVLAPMQDVIKKGE